MNQYPRIPDCPAQQPGEDHQTYGLRCFRYLVAERVTPGVLTDDQLAAALHFSQIVVTAKDAAAAALDCYHAIRLQIQAAQHERQTAASSPQAPQGATIAPAAAPQAGTDGGARDRQPTPPTRPTPPSTAATWAASTSRPDWNRPAAPAPRQPVIIDF